MLNEHLSSLGIDDVSQHFRQRVKISEHMQAIDEDDQLANIARQNPQCALPDRSPRSPVLGAHDAPAPLRTPLAVTAAYTDCLALTSGVTLHQPLYCAPLISIRNKSNATKHLQQPIPSTLRAPRSHSGLAAPIALTTEQHTQPHV